jgi:hypothetical protein
MILLCQRNVTVMLPTGIRAGNILGRLGAHYDVRGQRYYDKTLINLSKGEPLVLHRARSRQCRRAKSEGLNFLLKRDGCRALARTPYKKHVRTQSNFEMGARRS